MLEAPRMIIGRGTEGDLHEVGRLWLAMVDELAPESEPNLDFWRAITVNLMRLTHYVMLVAEEGRKIIGFVDFGFEVDAATSRIQMTTRHFYVIPEARGTGVAGRLYRAGMRTGQDRGARDVVFLAGDRERPFWERHGYERGQNVMRKAIA